LTQVQKYKKCLVLFLVIINLLGGLTDLSWGDYWNSNYTTGTTVSPPRFVSKTLEKEKEKEIVFWRQEKD
jgi:hypothetical protein